jgi:hypothetical protein
MSQMPPGMEAALAAERAVVFAAIDMDTPGRKVRLLVNGGFIVWQPPGSLLAEDGSVLLDEAGNLVAAEPIRYESRDDVFGVFSDIEALSDGVGNEAPSVQVSLIPPSDVATGQVSAVELQGSPFRIWVGVVDTVTGMVVDEPMLIFDGQLDTATIRIDENGNRKVDYEITSVFEQFFLANDMARLSDGFHQYLWPGELGCDHVTWVTHQIYWGTESPDGVTL